MCSDSTQPFVLCCVVCVFLEVNEKTTKVIEAAFKHARYPSVKGQKSMLIGEVLYGLDK